MRDFYDHQDTARHNTNRMVAWMILAVVGTALVSGILFGYAAVLLVHLQLELTAAAELAIFTVTFVIAAFATGCFVTIVSWTKVRQIRREGGASLARGLGGQHITEDDHDPEWRRLLNVVQEIAVAAEIHPPTSMCYPKNPELTPLRLGFPPAMR